MKDAPTSYGVVKFGGDFQRLEIAVTKWRKTNAD